MTSAWKKLDFGQRKQIARRYFNDHESLSALADELGMKPETLSRRLREVRQLSPEDYPKSTLPPPDKVLPDEAPSEFPSDETHEYKGDHWNISLKRTRIHTLDELLAFFEVDLDEWEVERFVVNKWEVGRKFKKIDWVVQGGVATGSVHDIGTIFVEPLYQVKAWLRHKTAKIDALAEIAALKEQAKADAPIPIIIEHPAMQSGNMLELSIPDLHLNKIARKQETGGDDYNLDIAARMFLEAIEVLLMRTGTYGIEIISLVVGNDLLNADNPKGTTTFGTLMSNDKSFYYSFVAARIMIVSAIERLRQIAPVLVVVVPGNHDHQAAWHLGDSLECYFANYRDVTIINEPTPRKYIQWGDVMLMWSHGDMKRSDYPLLMATEQPIMFGQTKFREAHLGHLHVVRLEETHGVRVRILPSLSAANAWESEHGFVGHLRSAEAYVWNKQEGLIATAVYTAKNEPEPL